MSKKQILFLSIVSGVLVVLAVGIAIPKLTVYDKVSVDKDFRNNVMQAFYVHSDNPIERIALWLGKSRIVSATPLSAEVESFTLFRIPLGFLRGIPDMKVSIFFNPGGDWSAKIDSDIVGFYSKLSVPVPDETPPGWYSHQVSASHIILTKQKELPNIGGTESYAYGDQINISVSEFNGNNPENWPHLIWIEDEALVKEKYWTEVSGTVALHVRHEAAGASGEQITWYLFDDKGGKVYELSLYMPQDKPNDETFGDFVRQYSKQLVEQDPESGRQAGDNSLWQTFVDQEQGIKFSYPKELIAGYIGTVDWPPVVNLSNSTDQLICDETLPESSLPQRIMRRQVDDRVYCVEALSEGAAGSVYTQYFYSTIWEGKLVTISFTLQFPQCYNYDEPDQTNCKEEREAFDLDGIVDRIVSSLKYN